MNLLQKLMKHVLNTAAISTAKDIYDTLYVTTDYRVGIFPFSVNKCDVTDTLLPHGAQYRGMFSIYAIH